METVINNIIQVKKNTDKNYTPSSLITHSHQVTNPLSNNKCVYFTICDDCYWCSSRITDKIKFDWCPSCQGKKINSISLSKDGFL